MCNKPHQALSDVSEISFIFRAIRIAVTTPPETSGGTFTLFLAFPQRAAKQVH